MEIYISTLLYRYRCVVIPEFGAFLTRSQPAVLNDGILYPPTKKLMFNAQLHVNDGLLAKHIAEAEKIPYEEALRCIAKTVEAWEKMFREQHIVSLKNIGELWRNAEQSIQFTPFENSNYLGASFGLHPVLSKPVKRGALKHHKGVVVSPIFTPKKRRAYYVKYASVFLLLIATGTVGYRVVKDEQLERYEKARQEAQQHVEHNIQRATFFDAKPSILPYVTVALNKTSYNYHVVAGAFRMKQNAERKSHQLLKKGYHAQCVGVNKYGLHLVAYGSFSKVEEALGFLRTVRASQTQDAWLWVSQ